MVAYGQVGRYRGRQVGVPSAAAAAGYLYKSRGNWMPYARAAGRKAQKYYKSWSRARKAKSFKKVAGVRRPRKRQFRASKSKSLKKRVKTLERHVADDISYKILKRRDSGVDSCAVNEVEYFDLTGSTVGRLETALSNVEFFNPSAPATPIVVDMDAGTYPQSIKIKAYATYKIWNQYAYDVKVKMYMCTVKEDTNTSPSSAYGSGVADLDATFDKNTPMLWPADSKVLNDIWKVTLVKSKVLKPGESCFTKSACPYVSFDPATIDVHASAYQKALKSTVCLVRIEGTMAIDSSLDEVGTTAGKVAYEVYSTFTVMYDSGGAKMRNIDLDDNYSTFTNNAVQFKSGKIQATSSTQLNNPCEVIAPLGNQTFANSVSVRETTL